MAAQKVRTRVSPKAEKGFLKNFELEEILPQKYHIPLVMFIVTGLYLIFLAPMYFSGMTFQSGDIMASESVQPYLHKAREGFTLWNPNIFLGMPAYGLGVGYTWFNIIYVLFTAVRNIFAGFFAVDYAKWSFYLIILSMTSYALMKHLTKNTLVSIFTAVATGFSTGLIVFLYIGHVTKLTSICMFPLIFLILFRFQEKIKLLDFLVLTVAAQLLIQGFHVQIIFYTLFAIGIYYLYFFIRSLLTKDSVLRNNLIKSAGLLAVAVLIGVAIQADNLTQIYEYTPYSTRGSKGIIETTSGTAEQSASEYYKYHTDWSFSPGEVLTFIVPSFYGYGYIPYKAPSGEEIRINTYFGQMPFVDVAMYMGVIVFMLALFAVATRFREPIVQFLTLLSFIALMISFGKNFPIFFDPMFKLLPYFDKFRVPSMILVLVQLCVPILAGLGLAKIVSLAKTPDANAKKLLYYIAIGCSVLFVASILFSGPAADSIRSRMNNSGEKTAQLIQQYQQEGFKIVVDEAAKMFSLDLIFAFLFLSVVFWLGYFASEKKVATGVFTGVVILLTIFDLFRISGRGKEWTANPDTKGIFRQPDYITAIKKQNDTEPFRMLNLKQDNSSGSIQQNSNFNAYFLVEDFYGYSAIKPRGFQDLMDVVGLSNPTLWDIANVKYLVFDKRYLIPGFKEIAVDEKYALYKNENALSRANFIDSIATTTNIDALNKIKENSFNPKKVAFVHDRQLKVDKPDSTAFIKTVKYVDEKLALDINASGNNFIFFSATYMPAGWKATVDGNSTEIIRVNHNFMGIVVPKGRHAVEFNYAPKSFYISMYVSLVLSSIVVLGLAFSIFMEVKKKKKEN